VRERERERERERALGHIEAWLDYQIVDCFEDVRQHVQLLLIERIAQRQLGHNLQGFFTPPHNAAVFDVCGQYRYPSHVMLVECEAHEGNEVWKTTTGLPYCVCE
jgi:hypothetical protein